jgi:hypothetical protein
MHIPITRLCCYNGAIGTLAIGLLGLSSGALALNLGFGDWQAHGFLSQGYTYTSGNDFFSLERRGLFPESAPRFLRDNTSESYYLQADYRFAPRWSALLRYDSFFANVDDRDARDTASLTDLPRHRFFAKDLTFGLRWEFARDWLVAAEYHNVYGTGWLSAVDNSYSLSHMTFHPC